MSNKSKRKHEQRKEYRGNPLADAHRALRGEAPPGYPSTDEMIKVLAAKDGYSPEHIEAALKRNRDAETLAFLKRSRQTGMRDAVDRANERLERKPHRDAERMKEAAIRQEAQGERIEIPEPELLAALEEARQAGRTTLTVEELAALLALPHPINYRDQRSFIRGK